ncbi:MAG: response regulator transcription factor [Bacteroidales bacterium]|nr:response regulator transcription factor [Bacteroidales bacterium]NCA77567.1 response regulator [Alphaproteobacteria bacterium]HNW73395.1 response regulator transcription factor [Bacteroidales bacterium]HPS50777.1 response regulator transcription factor [Bacteroidales bacterium]
MKKKILAIDDEKSIRFIIENTFNKDFDVTSISNGMDALFYLQSGNLPDLIICDVEMPVLNGFEFIKRIRESGFFDEIPLIMLSGKEESADKIKCFEMGADDYVLKPFNPKELIARIKRRLEFRDLYTQRRGN